MQQIFSYDSAHVHSSPHHYAVMVLFYLNVLQKLNTET